MGIAFLMKLVPHAVGKGIKAEGNDGRDLMIRSSLRCNCPQLCSRNVHLDIFVTV